MKRILAFVLALAAFAVMPALAQQGPRAVLEYFQNSSGDMVLKLALVLIAAYLASLPTGERPQ